jgi:hypothetical protein
MKSVSSAAISVAVFLAMSGDLHAEDCHTTKGAASTGKTREQVRAELVQAENDGLIFVRSRDYPLDAPKMTRSTEVYEVQASRIE